MTFGYLPGARDRIAPITMAQAIHVSERDKLPVSFPLDTWNNMQARYFEYWAWFNGDRLDEPIRDKNGNPTKSKKYPLGINIIRNFARKHAAILLGEGSFDSGQPLVKTTVAPRPTLKPTKSGKVEMPMLMMAQPQEKAPPAPPANKDGSQAASTVPPPEPPVPVSVQVTDDEFSEEDRVLAKTIQNVVNEVWIQSDGRAIQMENATMTQFLGGCVFQLVWHAPWDEQRKEKRIPVSIYNIVPDFFLPVWHPNQPWNLLEAYVIYRIPAAAARKQFGIDTIPANGYVIYTEHWTRDHYSIYIDAQPLKTTTNGITMVYDHVENPFDMVPFVYIPHVREGSFWGSSICEDLIGLTKEYNARLADVGDNIHDMVHREYFARDLGASTAPVKINENVTATNLGHTNIATKSQPEVYTIEPMPLGESAVQFADSTLWTQMRRVGDLSDVAYGEDEGSQRSALTLAFRMWPSTSHARVERTFWTEGLNHLAKMIIKMLVAKSDDVDVIALGLGITDDFARRVHFGQDWLPMIPRDREQEVNEVVYLFQTGLMSPERALNILGGVEYVGDEIRKIIEWKMFESSLSGLGKSSMPGGNPSGSTGAANSTMNDPTSAVDAEQSE